MKRTTRDEPDYDRLMQYRLDILDENGFTLSQIHDVIDSLDPLPGAQEFVEWAKSESRLVILSDTFQEFAGPLMASWDTQLYFVTTLRSIARIASQVINCD